MRASLISFISGALLLLGSGPARAAEIVPLMKLDLLGGQFFYEGAHTSFSGNGDLLLSPAVKLTDNDTIVPTITSQYRRTREVRELVGGGFLTQESLATLVGLKYVRRLSDVWSLKPALSYKNELLNETEEERLGKGLFDYHKVSAALEAERRTETLSLRPAVSVYGVRYYHYHTLSSSDQELGAEINAGDRVLDFNAYDLSLNGEHLVADGTLLSFSALGSYRPFLDQNLVSSAGTYLEKKREDFYLAGAAGVQQRLPDYRRLQSVAALLVTYAHLLSNQNNYDASRTQFNGDYYDYGELTLAPTLGGKLGPLWGSAGYEFSRRRYPQRPVQTADGSYSAVDKIRINVHTVTLQLAYQLTKRLSLKTQGAWRRSESNMTYEGSYKYNYDSAHYFAGIGLDF